MKHAYFNRMRMAGIYSDDYEPSNKVVRKRLTVFDKYEIQEALEAMECYCKGIGCELCNYELYPYDVDDWDNVDEWLDKEDNYNSYWFDDDRKPTIIIAKKIK